MRKKGIWVVVSVLVVLGLLLGGFGCKAPAPTPVPTPTPTPAAPEVIHWRGQNSFTPGAEMGPMPTSGYWLPGYFWVKWIEEASDGRLVIDVAPPGGIFPVPESLHAVGEGIVDVVTSSYGPYWGGTMPEANIEPGMPYATESGLDLIMWWWWYGAGDIFREAYLEHNVVWFGAAANNVHGMGATFSLDSPDAIKGKKMRAPGVEGDLIQLLGGSPITLPWGEIYMALKLGTVDGYIGGVSALHTEKLREVLTYYYGPPGVKSSGINLLINKDSLDALPDDLREMILRDTDAVLLQVGQLCLATELYLIGHTPEVTFQSWSEEDVARVRKLCVEELWPKLAAPSPRCAELVDLVIQYNRDMGRL